MKEHVTLVGFMGAGKTTLGRRLARVLGRRFVDTDSLVVAARGIPIADIFKEEGEAAFRGYEESAVNAALDGTPAVVALRGGAVAHWSRRNPHSQAALGSVRIYVAYDAAMLHRRRCTVAFSGRFSA